MSRIYERHYCSLAAMGGEATCWELPFFCEGFLTKILVQQVGGTPVDFTLNIYNSNRACEHPSSSSSAEAADGQCIGSADMYKVLPQLTGTAGQTTEFISEVGYAYRNQVGTYVQPVRKIYVQIEPQGSEQTAWDLVLGGTQDVG